MQSSQLIPVDPLFELKNFETYNLQVNSQCLKGNPLGDSLVRPQFLLKPKSSRGSLKVVFHLCGYFSTGYQKFGVRTLEKNIPQKIDQLTSKSLMAPALHVFVDATTFWGGSQFIDSPGSGHYGQFVLKELPKELNKHFDLKKDWIVSGASSGGYGALQLISKPKSPFKKAVAVAPDSFFEMSLLPEIYKVAHKIKKISSLKSCREALGRGEEVFKGSFFSLVNVLAMAHCYSSKEDVNSKKINWPIDLESGQLDQKVWKRWKTHDPLSFLPRRIKNLKGKKIVLKVGSYDEYHLQFGTRQIKEILSKNKISYSYSEFPRGHRNLTVECLDGLTKTI